MQTLPFYLIYRRACVITVTSLTIGTRFIANSAWHTDDLTAG